MQLTLYKVLFYLSILLFLFSLVRLEGIANAYYKPTVGHLEERLYFHYYQYHFKFSWAVP